MKVSKVLPNKLATAIVRLLKSARKSGKIIVTSKKKTLLLLENDNRGTCLLESYVACDYVATEAQLNTKPPSDPYIDSRFQNKVYTFKLARVRDNKLEPIQRIPVES